MVKAHQRNLIQNLSVSLAASTSDMNWENTLQNSEICISIILTQFKYSYM